MTAKEILSRLEGVKGGYGQWTARCPAHDDRHQSLSISEKDGKILLHCHANCSLQNIVDAMGITVKDLFTDIASQSQVRNERGPIVAIYDYKDGNGDVIAQKIRYNNKTFCWRRPDGKGGWIYDRKGVPYRLYVAGELSGAIYVCEGEKDADNFHELLGGCAVSGADGAGPGKWRSEYTEQLRGRTVIILPDHDDIGRAYAQETAAALYGAAKSIRLLDLSKVWPEILNHGDVSDLIAAKGANEAGRLITSLAKETPEWRPNTTETDPLLALFKPLEDFPEEEAKWVVDGWIPEGQISVIAADGGIGKTTLWCHIIAALSCGSTCILDLPGTTRSPMEIMFLTTEDSIRKKLRKKLRLAGANMNNIITPDFSGDQSGALHKLKFGTPEMAKVLRTFHPDLCIFDPIQGFTPPKANMASRNEMRDCMSSLIALGEELNLTSIIICHTNKRKGASGRDRIADSADIWDISRSVLMAGVTEEPGIRYLSNEKNNYAPLQETILFSIDSSEQIHKDGTSWKRDKDYMQGTDTTRAAPKREDCKVFILQALENAGGVMPTKDLETATLNAGYTSKTLRNAKEELKDNNEIKCFPTGNPKGGNRGWHTQLARLAGFMEISKSGPTPFDNSFPV